MDGPGDSAEIVEDFKEALLDLKLNSKPAIDVLTVIAKENTTYAEAISDVLEEHIKTARPEWKFPALLVLDSLIRHVGPPYSHYLARNLFTVFMDMYTRVGATTRRDMDFILRTWKDPPQGSRDPQPVLPVDITRQIENALIRFRTISFQQNQQQNRQLAGRVPPSGSKEKAGPMNAGPNNGPAASAAEAAEYMTTLQQRPGAPNFNPGAAYQPNQATRSPVPQPVLPVAQSLPVSFNGVPPNYSAQQQLNQSAMLLQSKLQNEVKQIIEVLTLQKVLAVGPPNLEIEQLLATLNALIKVLNSEALGLSPLQTVQAELVKISDRMQKSLPAELVMLLKAASQPPVSLSAQAPVPATFQSTAPFAALLSAAPPYPIHSTSTPPPMARFPPPAPTALPLSIAPYPLPTAAFSSIPALQPPGSNAFPAQPTVEVDLIAQLRAAGLLPPTDQNPAPNPHPRSIGRRFGVKLDQDSITKVPRVDLISSLYEEKPDQCRQCGRRFPATEKGKQAKSKHLDWHFRTNSRVADSADSAIVHRSPYLDASHWIQLRETQDDADAEETDGAAAYAMLAPGGSAAAGREQQEEGPFVPVPTDVARRHEPCSICMELFRERRHKETGQAVWMNVVKVGDKYYHLTCYNDVNKGVGGAGQGDPMAARRTGGRAEEARGTPEPLLGKRKFEAA